MNNPSLFEVQQALQQYLLNQSNSIDGLTLETEKFSKEQRLAIYHDAYRLRLVEVLQNDYPALQALLGEDIFEKLAIEYIEKYPSQHPSLRWLGEKLPLFLQSHPSWQQHIHIIELAKFEWAQIMIFDAEDSISATMDDLRNLDHSHWPQLQLNFQPALQRLSFFSNAPHLWHSLTNTENTPHIIITEDTQEWLVWRQDLQIMYKPIDKAEAWCLDSFLHQQNFTTVCEGLCEWFPEDQVPLKAVQYLQSWLQNGLITSIQ